jgi:hypothetical protein
MMGAVPTALLLACAALTLSSRGWAADGSPSAPKQSLQAAAADPTWPLIQAALDYDFAVSNRGGNGSAYRLLFQPVIPLPPFEGFPIGQIIRPSLPLIESPGPDRVTGLGDLTIFDVFLPRRFSWGALGAGPVFVFPTATDDRLGQGKWQLGPAAALIYQAIPHVQIGAILQNPISFAGDADRSSVNQLLVQPIAQYNFPDGWYVSMGDLSWTFDWKQGGEATIPLAFQAGRVFPLFGQQWNLAVEPFYTVVHSGPSPRWGFRFGFSLLLPEGP